MARTKASVGAKVSFGKSSKGQKNSPRPPPSNSGNGKSSSKPSWSGGNSYCPRETPDWQQPITHFFKDFQGDHRGESSGSNRPRKKINVIDSDTESDRENAEVIEPRVAATADEVGTFEADGADLDRTGNGEADLPPLVDDNSSHKIKEYFARTKSDTTGKDSEVADEDASAKGAKNKGVGKSSNKRKTQNGEFGKNKENQKPVNVETSSPKESFKKRSIDSVDNENIERDVKKIKI